MNISYGMKMRMTNDIKWGDKKELNYIKRYDYGIEMGVGLKYQKCQLSLMYKYGLANISPFNDYGYRLQNRVISISIGYNLLLLH